MRRLYGGVAGFLLLAAVAGQATADVVMLAPSKDNTLYESVEGGLSNGKGDFIFAGMNGVGFMRRAVIAFDLTSAIPVGSTINSVTLTLRMSRTSTGTVSVTLQPLLADWGEGISDASGNEGGGAVATPGDATWRHRAYDNEFWISPGGDFDPAVSASANVGGTGTYNWSSAGLVADVQGWVNDPSSNFGWIIRAPEGGGRTAKRFDSVDNDTVSNRPVLTINFTPPPVSGACCFDGGACLILVPSECTLQGGSYQGDFAPCSPNPCPQPTGACCFGNSTCLVLTPGECADQNGYYQGDDVPCSMGLCPLLTGACCANDGTCQVLSEADCDLAGDTYRGDNTTCEPDTCDVVLEPFVDALPIPPIAQPTSGSPGGTASYVITMEQVQQQLHRDLPPTTVWAYNGEFPGPTIEAFRDMPVTVTWANDLRDELGQLRTDHLLPVDPCPHGAENVAKTVVHLHGGHVPAEYDGYPEDTFLPGESAVYVYPNNQLPSLLWYHDHALGSTRLNVYLGLAGAYIIRDFVELAINLPDGQFEIPLIFMDRSFNVDGTFKYPAEWHEHFFGNHMLVNGKVTPFLNVSLSKYRFRMLNASNARTLTLSLSNGATFAQIGTDGGLLPAPVTVNQVTLAPAERADVIIDFQSYGAGTEIILTNAAPAPYPGTPGVGVVPNVMKFVVQNAGGHTDPVPGSLRSINLLDPNDAAHVRDFELRRFTDDCTDNVWLINGHHWDHITEHPRLDTSEIWRFINRSEMGHPMHMHLVMFQVLDRQDFTLSGEDIVPIGSPVPPPPEEAGWKDTVMAYPQQITRVIARFEDYRGKFAYHCHILEHEDHEMMRQFQILEPGDFDGDGDVDLADFALFSQCFNGTSNPPAPSCPAHTDTDIDGDGDVDIVDFAYFSQLFTGSQ